jgi:hypothetical protein
MTNHPDPGDSAPPDQPRPDGKPPGRKPSPHDAVFRCGRPPAQIPASGITALGSYHGWVAAKRCSGNGCVMRVAGSQRLARRFILSQVIRPFWLRRESACRQCRVA